MPATLSPSPARPASAVVAVERVLLLAEGPYHVRGRYIADVHLAERARRREAERQVAEALRFTCPWCERAVSASEPVTLVGGRALHAPCAEAFDRHAYGADPVFAPLDESDAAVLETLRAEAVR